MVKDINLTRSSNPNSFKELGGKFYFTAETDDMNRELYVTVGTETGTKVIVPDISPNINPCGNTYRFFEINNGLCFRANYSSFGDELYKITDLSLSIVQQKELSSFNAYPNPTKARLTITTEENTSSTLHMPY